MRDNANEASAGACAPEILILGLGNYLLRDEGVGVHAIRAVAGNRPEGVLAVEVGTAVLRAEDLLRSAQLVIAFDAVQAGGPPGSLYAANAMGMTSGGLRGSLHEYGLLEALMMMPGNPPETLILGVEPEVIDCGCELSAPVQAAIPRMVDLALAAVGFWRSASVDGNRPCPGSLLEWLGTHPGVRHIRAEEAERTQDSKPVI